MSEVIISHQTKKAIDALLKIGVPLAEAYRVMGIVHYKHAA